MAAYEESTTDVGGIVEEYRRDQARQQKFNPRQAGDYYLRLLPPIVGVPGQKAKVWRKFGAHYKFDLLRGRPGMDPKTVRCLKKSLDQNCFADTVNEQLFAKARLPNNQIDQPTFDLAKDTRPADRYVANVLPCTPKNTAQDGGVKTWEFGKTIYDQLRALFAEWGDITHPEEGYVIRVTFEQKGMWSSAKSVAITPQRGPIPLPTWREDRHNLDEYVEGECMTVDEMKAMFVTVADTPEAHDVTRIAREMLGDPVVAGVTEGAAAAAPIGTVAATPVETGGASDAFSELLAQAQAAEASGSPLTPEQIAERVKAALAGKSA